MSSENKMGVMPINKLILSMSIPMMLSMLIQALYNIVDSMFVAQISENALTAVSLAFPAQNLMIAVATGTGVGINATLSRSLGEKNFQKANRIAIHALFLAFMSFLAFAVFGLFFAEHFFLAQTRDPEIVEMGTVYLQICTVLSFGLFGEIAFERLMQSTGRTFYSMIIQGTGAILNIILDPIMIFGLLGFPKMGVAGAALATVAAQAASVLLSLAVIRRRTLPFTIGKKNLRFERRLVGKILALGTPIALQDLLVSISFLVILAIVNSMGVIASAGVGVAEKLCAFIMLVASAYMQSMSAFVAQNMGAGKPERAKRALLYGIGTSLMAGVTLFYFSFFHGDAMAGIFARDPQVVAAAADYLKAYAIDCILTSFLFCFVGYFNGCGKTFFVMVQGIVGAFCVRIPVSWFMSRMAGVTLFKIGLATPCSSAVQILLCAAYFIWLSGRSRKHRTSA